MNEQWENVPVMASKAEVEVWIQEAQVRLGPLTDENENSADANLCLTGYAFLQALAYIKKLHDDLEGLVCSLESRRSDPRFIAMKDTLDRARVQWEK